MKEEWRKFYKGITEGKNKDKCYKGFIAYCELLEQCDGQPLSDYINNNTNVTFEVFNMTVSMICNHVKRYIEQLFNILRLLKENKDEFISLIRLTKIDMFKLLSSNKMAVLIQYHLKHIRIILEVELTSIMN